MANTFCVLNRSCLFDPIQCEQDMLATHQANSQNGSTCSNSTRVWPQLTMKFGQSNLDRLAETLRKLWRVRSIDRTWHRPDEVLSGEHNIWIYHGLPCREYEREKSKSSKELPPSHRIAQLFKLPTVTRKLNMSKLRLPTPNLPLIFEISWNLVESGNTHTHTHIFWNLLKWAVASCSLSPCLAVRLRFFSLQSVRPSAISFCLQTCVQQQS